MEVLKVLFEKIFFVYQYDMNILGFHFSLWSVVVWTVIGSILIYILVNLIN